MDDQRRSGCLYGIAGQRRARKHEPLDGRRAMAGKAERAGGKGRSGGISGSAGRCPGRNRCGRPGSRRNAGKAV